MITPERVEFERHVDQRLDELAGRSERRVPRYPEQDYGEPAPAWAQRYPRLIHAWAWLRAIGWMLRGYGL